MNILVIAPHPDDEAIGCGGAICKHVDAGDLVHAVFLTSGEQGLKHLECGAACKVREAEAAAAAQVLGLAGTHFLRQPDWTLGNAIAPAAAALVPVLVKLQPHIIYAPHPGEWHPDHKAAVAILLEALARAAVAPREIRGYEVWTPMSEFQVTLDISAVMPRKLAAIRCHESQFAELDYAQAAQGLNAYRGAMATRTAYAEVFQSPTAKRP